MKDYIIVIDRKADSKKFDNFNAENSFAIVQEFSALPCHFVVSMTDEVADLLLRESWVSSISNATDNIYLSQFQALDLTQNDNWGLDKIDHPDLILNNLYQYSRTGKNVDVYVIDSGIRTSHIEFGTRASILYDYFLGSGDPNYGIDIYGHGTSVASVIGGIKVGVAKECNLKSVRVFYDSSTNVTAILAGINAVISDHNSKNGALPTTDPNYRASVANMSWNLPNLNTAIDAAVVSMANAGISCIVSAGNYGVDVKQSSPASAGITYNVATQTYVTDVNNKPLVVSGYNISDIFDVANGNMLSGNAISNYGSEIEMLAPSYEISSADIFALNISDPNYPYTDAGFKQVSGTSIAAAFASGAAALYLEADKGASNITTKTALINNATKDKISFYVNDSNFLSLPNNALFTYYINNSIAWITNTGVILTETEGKNFNIPLTAVSNDEVGYPLSVTYSVQTDVDSFFSGNISLDPNTGIISGTLPFVPESVIAGLPGILGQKYTFVIRTSNGIQTVDRTFEVVVASNNQAPEWNTRAVFELNNITNSSNPYDVGNTLNINFQNLTDSTGSFVSVTDPDGDAINFSVLSGTLPPGISLSNVGVISGTITAFPINTDSSGTPITTTKDYIFTVRTSDSKGKYSDKSFKLNIQRQAIASQNTAPAWSSVSGKIGAAFQTQNVSISVIASDADGDKVVFSYQGAPTDPGTPANGSAVAEGTVFYNIPTGLSVSSSGIISGIVDDTNLPGQYWFDVGITDGINAVIKRSFYISVITKPAITTVSEISWVTKTGTLGSLNETEYSHYEVIARAAGQTELTGVKSNPTIEAGSNSPVSIKLNERDIVFPASSNLSSIIDAINLLSAAHGVIASDAAGFLKLISPNGDPIIIQDVTPTIDTNNASYNKFSILTGVPNFTTAASPNLEYALSPSSGPLPNGLSITTVNGIAGITGIADYVAADTTYDFTIRASVPGSAFIFSDRDFSITIKNVYSNPISDVAMPMIGTSRAEWEIFHFNALTINSSPIIDREVIFQLGSDRFGIRSTPSMYLLGGLSSITDTNFWNVLNLDNVAVTNPASTHYKHLDLLLGDLKKAVGRDLTTGEVVYEVIYYEVLDPNKNAGGFNKTTSAEEPLTYPQSSSTFNIKNITRLYPASLFNWRADLKNKIGLEGVERMPLWMACEQTKGDSTSILGFVPSLEVVFVKPGFGDTVISNIKNASSNNGLAQFTGTIMSVDRYFYESISGSIISTSFDTSTTTFDTNSTTFDVQPITKTGKYFKFPPGDI